MSETHNQEFRFNVPQEDVEKYFEYQLNKIIKSFNKHKENWYQEQKKCLVYWPTFYLNMNKPPKPKKTKTVGEVTEGQVKGETSYLLSNELFSPTITFNPFEVLTEETQTDFPNEEELVETISKLRKEIDEMNVRLLVQNKKIVSDKETNTQDQDFDSEKHISGDKKGRKGKEKEKEKNKKVKMETKEVIKEVIVPVIKEEDKANFVKDVIELNKITREISHRLDRDNFEILNCVTPILEKFMTYTNSKSYLMTIDTLIKLIKPLLEYIKTTLSIDKFLSQNPDFVKQYNMGKV
jgi:hypothetical protein